MDMLVTIPYRGGMCCLVRTERGTICKEYRYKALLVERLGIAERYRAKLRVLHQMHDVMCLPWREEIDVVKRVLGGLAELQDRRDAEVRQNRQSTKLTKYKPPVGDGVWIGAGGQKVKLEDMSGSYMRQWYDKEIMRGVDRARGERQSRPAFYTDF